MYSKINWGNRTKSHLYKRWLGMMQRCYNPNAQNYRLYGGRGIRVCEEWHEFENFRKFFEPLLPQGTKNSIDRIDVNGDYCPENVRIVSRLEQNLNKRNTRWVKINGEQKRFYDVVKESGIAYRTLERRLRAGDTGNRLLRPLEKRSNLHPVVQMSAEGRKIREWDSMADAARSLGCCSSNIGACCRGKRNFCAGFRWRYKI